MIKATDYRAMSMDELRQKEADLRKELFNLRFRKVTGEIENPMRIRIVRKDIARLLTVMREKSQTRE